MNKDIIQKAVTEIIKAIGDDPGRPGLADTPRRVAEMYSEIFSFNSADVEKCLGTYHSLEHDEMVIVKDIPFYSVCEHHMIPFFGKCHVGYIPKENKIAGISKLARIVDLFSKKLQIQERLTSEIVDSIMKYLNPKGAAVVVSARHLCMEMRGIKKPGAETITSAIRGIFRKDNKTREEFLKLIG